MVLSCTHTHTPTHPRCFSSGTITIRYVLSCSGVAALQTVWKVAKLVAKCTSQESTAPNLSQLKPFARVAASKPNSTNKYPKNLQVQTIEEGHVVTTPELDWLEAEQRKSSVEPLEDVEIEIA